MSQLSQLLDEEEGPSSAVAYRDSRGLLTIARGVLIDPTFPGAGMSQAGQDIENGIQMNAAIKRAAALPGYFQCNQVRRDVLGSICYQLGDLHDWPHAKACLAAGDYAGFAKAMQTKSDGVTPSQWVSQTPRRARRECAMMVSGMWIDRNQEIPV